jgi:hypothetical protein
MLPIAAEVLQMPAEIDNGDWAAYISKTVDSAFNVEAL